MDSQDSPVTRRQLRRSTIEATTDSNSTQFREKAKINEKASRRRSSVNKRKDSEKVEKPNQENKEDSKEDSKEDNVKEEDHITGNDDKKETLSSQRTINRKLWYHNILSERENNFQFSKAVRIDSRKRFENLSSMEIYLLKAIAVIMESKELTVSDDFFFSLSNYVDIYFSKLMFTLHKYTESQRRRMPSYSDLKLSLQEFHLTPSEIYSEYLESIKIHHKLSDKMSRISTEVSYDTNLFNNDAHTDITGSYATFSSHEDSELTELVPKQFPKPPYVPSFMPEFPPDYTYRSTPWYNTSLDDLKKVRLQLVKEARLTERPLYTLMEDEDRKWRDKIESRISTLTNSTYESDSQESIISESLREVTSGANTPVEENYNESGDSPADKKHNDINCDIQVESVSFDILSYAKKRADIKERREAKQKQKRRAKDDNVFLNAEKYLSPYGKEMASSETYTNFQDIIEKQFVATIKSVRCAEKLKKRKINKILEERSEKKEIKDSNIEKLEFGMNFGNSGDLSDYDSEESNIDLTGNGAALSFASDLRNRNTVLESETVSLTSSNVASFPPEDTASHFFSPDGTNVEVARIDHPSHHKDDLEVNILDEVDASMDDDSDELETAI